MDATQDRREFKFLLPLEDGEEFRRFIADRIPVDRGAEGGYPVLSTYFDTPDRHSYWQKVWGVGNRRRVRARVYGRPEGRISPAAFIEIKHKQDENGVKRRASVPIAELEQLSSGQIPQALLRAERPRADKQLVEELRDLIITDGARPVVQVRYDRMAYDHGSEGTLRITFDTGLFCRFTLKPLTADDKDFPLPVVASNIAVVEVKTIGPVPLWLRGVAGKFQLSAQSMSKYCMALERFDANVARFPLSREISPA